jgi:TetR/AcrR family transcriptional regulator, mexJK operon transcriptional repressor
VGPRGGRPAKRQAIVDAATCVFLRHGYAETSVDAIAAEAGVAKQTIYNHFGDKRQLFLAVIQAVQRDLGIEPGTAGDLEEWLGNSDDLGRDLRMVGRDGARAMMRPEIAGLRRLIIAEWDREPELLAEWARPRPMLELALARAIERQAARGVLDVDDAALAARQFLMVVLNEAVARSFFGRRQLTDAELDEIVDTGVDMWLRCYRVRPAG